MNESIGRYKKIISNLEDNEEIQIFMVRQH